MHQVDRIPSLPDFPSSFVHIVHNWHMETTTSCFYSFWGELEKISWYSSKYTFLLLLIKFNVNKTNHHLVVKLGVPIWHLTNKWDLKYHTEVVPNLVNGNILAVIYDCFYDKSLIFKQLEGLHLILQLWQLTPIATQVDYIVICVKKNYNGLLHTFKGKF